MKKILVFIMIVIVLYFGNAYFAPPPNCDSKSIIKILNKMLADGISDPITAKDIMMTFDKIETPIETNYLDKTRTCRVNVSYLIEAKGEHMEMSVDRNIEISRTELTKYQVKILEGFDDLKMSPQ